MRTLNFTYKLKMKDYVECNIFQSLNYIAVKITIYEMTSWTIEKHCSDELNIPEATSMISINWCFINRVKFKTIFFWLHSLVQSYLKMFFLIKTLCIFHLHLQKPLKRWVPKKIRDLLSFLRVETVYNTLLHERCIIHFHYTIMCNNQIRDGFTHDKLNISVLFNVTKISTWYLKKKFCKFVSSLRK